RPRTKTSEFNKRDLLVGSARPSESRPVIVRGALAGVSRAVAPVCGCWPPSRPSQPEHFHPPWAADWRAGTPATTLRPVRLELSHRVRSGATPPYRNPCFSHRARDRDGCWRRRRCGLPPAAPARTPMQPPRIATLLFTDVEGSTPLLASLGDTFVE